MSDAKQAKAKVEFDHDNGTIVITLPMYESPIQPDGKKLAILGETEPNWQDTDIPVRHDEGTSFVKFSAKVGYNPTKTKATVHKGVSIG